MVIKLQVEGFDAFVESIEANKGKDVFCYFSGSKDSSGKSWCPDCVTAEPVVKAAMEKVSDLVSDLAELIKKDELTLRN